MVSRRIAVLSSLFAVLAGTGRAAAAAEQLKVAYHLTDIEKVTFVLGNIRNHIEGEGGPDKVRIALVVHGPALRAFRRAADNPAVSRPQSELAGKGVTFHACENTLKGMGEGPEALLDGFEIVPEGGVVRLARLQAQGWLYLRP